MLLYIHDVYSTSNTWQHTFLTCAFDRHTVHFVVREGTHDEMLIITIMSSSTLHGLSQSLFCLNQLSSTLNEEIKYSNNIIIVCCLSV